MLIVDSQVHVWAADTPERPWTKGAKPHRPEPFGADALLREMSAAGVDRAILVPPSFDGGLNDLAFAAAEAHPDKFAVMGKLDPDAAHPRRELAAWRADPGMLGVRINFKTNPDNLSSGRMNWVWEVAEKKAIPMYVGVTHSDVHYVDAIAERHPELTLILDHMALASGAKDDEAFRDLDKLLAIAKRPNVGVKVSALPDYTTEAYPHSSLHPYVRRVYDAFGPKRMFWGSDLTRLKGSYRQCVTLFTEEMSWLSSADLEWIMGRALCDWLRWDMP